MSFARILREPFLHFLLLGAALFLVDRRPRAEPEVDRVEVTAEVRRELSARFESQRGRAPSAEELALLEARWRDEEILYRAGLARRLDEGDPLVRERVARKMAEVLRASAVVPEPTVEELHAFFEAAPERWAKDARFDFTHVFVADDDEARARELLERLETGASPAGLGDRFQGGRRYRRRTISQLAEAFGDEFVKDLPSQPRDVWQLRRSRHGLHLVRLDGRQAAREASFEAVEEEVREAWREARREEAFERAMEELRRRW